MNVDIGGNGVKSPSPSVDEIMEEPDQEPNSSRNVEVEEPEPPREFLDGIVIGPKEIENKFNESGMEESTIPYWLRERIKAKALEEAHSEESTSVFLAMVSKPIEIRPPKPAKSSL